MRVRTVTHTQPAGPPPCARQNGACTPCFIFARRALVRATAHFVPRRLACVAPCERCRCCAEPLVSAQVVTNGGNTALHLACITGDVATVSELLRVGVRLWVADNLGRTALDLADAMGHRAVAAILARKPSCPVRVRVCADTHSVVTTT